MEEISDITFPEKRDSLRGKPVFDFPFKNIEFIIGCILVSLQCVHRKGIIHRDIKPENLVFDADGYLHLTDFGIARIWNPNNAQDTSGTPGYMGIYSIIYWVAPEVMCRSNHGVAADYFAVGVIAYECMMGKVMLIHNKNRDLILGEHERKLEIKYYQDKSK